MNSKTGKATIVLAILVLASGVLAFHFSNPPAEPELNGRPLSYYLDNQTYGELRTERDARESIRDFGSNAVPHLVRILEARESRVKTWLRSLAQRQSFLRLRFTPLAVRQSQAAIACAELGPLAAAASPALAGLVDDPLLCRDAITALAMIGPENFPLLTNVLAGGIPAARAAAAGNLRLMLPRTKPVPVLLAALRDPEPEVRANAAGSLGFLGCQPERIVTALARCLADPDLSVRLSAAQSLGWLRQHSAAAIPALRDFLREQEGTPAAQKIAEAIDAIEGDQGERASGP